MTATTRRTWIALLRGINVGGHKRVAMADLRSVLEGLGLGDVRTYVQSGNAVFSSPREDAARLERRIAGGLRDELGVDAAVVVRSAGELGRVIAGNPFAGAAAADPTRVHAGFLSAMPDARGTFEADSAKHAPERLVVGDRVLWLHLPSGIGRSALATLIDRRARSAGLVLTVRNWRTVLRLHEMAGER